MARKVTTEDIAAINAAYAKHKTYSGAAKETGWSASTVKKYIVEGTPSVSTSRTSEPISPAAVKRSEDWGYWLKLTEEEVREIEKLRGEFLL